MLYLAQLRLRDGDADEDFLTLKSWIFESDDVTLDLARNDLERGWGVGYRGLAIEATAALRALGEDYGNYEIFLHRIEQVSLEGDVLTDLTRLSQEHLQKSGYVD